VSFYVYVDSQWVKSNDPHLSGIGAGENWVLVCDGPLESVMSNTHPRLTESRRQP
jgi:hypothetical protein